MIIGLIGGVGSGKSTVSNYLETKYGFIILEADTIVKEMEKPGHKLYKSLVDCFGEDILISGKAPDRPIDKERFSALIYRDREAMKKTNSIIHPVAWAYIESQTKTPGKFVVETALPDENFPERCDIVWYIYADQKIRIKRLMARRGYSAEKSLSIINNQLKSDEFKALSDRVIDNSKTPDDLIAQVDKLMAELSGHHRGPDLI